MRLLARAVISCERNVIGVRNDDAEPQMAHMWAIAPNPNAPDARLTLPEQLASL